MPFWASFTDFWDPGDFFSGDPNLGTFLRSGRNFLHCLIIRVPTKRLGRGIRLGECHIGIGLPIPKGDRTHPPIGAPAGEPQHIGAVGTPRGEACGARPTRAPRSGEHAGHAVDVYSGPRPLRVTYCEVDTRKGPVKSHGAAIWGRLARPQKPPGRLSRSAERCDSTRLAWCSLGETRHGCEVISQGRLSSGRPRGGAVGTRRQRPVPVAAPAGPP